MGLAAILQGATGVAGLISGMGRNKQAGAMNAAALRNLEMRNQLQGQANSWAMNYDPRTEDAAGANYATGKVNRDIGVGLKGLNAQFRNMGGSPTGDSLFNVNVNNLVRSQVGPLAALLADQASSITSRKLAALGQASGMDQGLASNYMNLGQMYQTDLGSSMGLIGSAIDGAVKPKGKPVGAATSSTKSAKVNR